MHVPAGLRGRNDVHVITARVRHKLLPVFGRERITQHPYQRLPFQPERVLKVHEQQVHLELRDGAHNPLQVIQVGHRSTAHINLSAPVTKRRPVFHSNPCDLGAVRGRPHQLTKRLHAIEESGAVFTGHKHTVSLDIQDIALLTNPLDVQVCRCQEISGLRVFKPRQADDG